MTISIKNTCVWLLDQLAHPWTLCQKRAWGVFSKYAHLRRSDERPKMAHATKEKALEVAESMGRKYGGGYSVYKCLYCDGWHVAKAGGNAIAKPKAENPMPSIPVNTELDLEKILALDIPDIAPAYGGVRGRTMSSVHQNFAWPVIREAGVRVIIDLREDGVYSRLSQLCEKYGMEYFYYPVDNHCGRIDEMVRLFPRLCQHIDAGNFYIACAMGLHRTDIALCAYWMFYAADKGIAPPPIRGYRKEDGHNTNKIMRVLNAMYEYLKEQNGAEPMPMEVFVSRKKIINEESKK